MSVHSIAVDLGASSGRVLLGRLDGNSFGLQELHRFENGPVEVLGHLHWDVLRIWSEIRVGLELYAREFDTPLESLGVDTWGVDYALLDERGGLLGNPYHYRDSRNDGMLEGVLERIPEERLFGRTGIQFMQINTLYQLFGTVQRDESALRHTSTLLMMPDLFHYWLTGEKRGEVTIASTSGMLDARTRNWATDLLEPLGIPTRILPELASPGTTLGKVNADLTGALGFHNSPLVIATGSHDTANAVAAIPELDDESVYISSGTWSLMGVELDEPILDERALGFNFTNEAGVGGRVRFLKNVAGLWLVQESRRQWRREGREGSIEELLGAAEEAAPFRSLIDPDHMDFSSPGNMPERIRAYCRRTGQPAPETPGEVVRCCLESLALRYRWVLKALRDLTGRKLTTVRVVGGGSQNDLLNRFTADACALRVVAGPVEATALGNVMMQAVATGHLPDIAAGRQTVAASVKRRHFEPRNPEGWNDAFERFKELLTP